MNWSKCYHLCWFHIQSLYYFYSDHSFWWIPYHSPYIDSCSDSKNYKTEVEQISFMISIFLYSTFWSFYWLDWILIINTAIIYINHKYTMNIESIIIHLNIIKPAVIFSSPGYNVLQSLAIKKWNSLSITTFYYFSY